MVIGLETTSIVEKSLAETRYAGQMVTKFEVSYKITILQNLYFMYRKHFCITYLKFIFLSSIYFILLPNKCRLFLLSYFTLLSLFLKPTE
jgi:hypothetical protein